MSFPMPPDLWHEYCRFREAYPTCEVIVYQSQGRVTKLACTVVIKSREEREGRVGYTPLRMIDKNEERA